MSIFGYNKYISCCSTQLCVCMCLCLCEAEVHSSLALQHHYRGAEGSERHRGAYQRGWRRELHPVWVHESLSDLQQLRHSQAGPEVDQDGGERKLTDALSCFPPSRILTFSHTESIMSAPPLYIGVPDCGGCLRTWGYTGRPRAVRSQHQQRHHRHRAGLPGGPGGHCCCSGSAVWTTGNRVFFSSNCLSHECAKHACYPQFTPSDHCYCCIALRFLFFRCQTSRPGYQLWKQLA